MKDEKECRIHRIFKWLGLIRTDGVGPVMFRRLLDHFKTFDRIKGASVAELSKVEGIGGKTAKG